MRPNLLPTSATLALFAFVAVFTTTADAAPKKPVVDAKAAAEFDKMAASTAIGEVDLSKCKATNAARGEGHAKITFAPAGEASEAKIDKGPWVGTPVARCMIKAFKTAKVPAFRGDAITVGKTFKFGE